MVAPMAPSCKSECLTSVGLPYAILFAGLGFGIWGLGFSVKGFLSSVGLSDAILFAGLGCRIWVSGFSFCRWWLRDCSVGALWFRVSGFGFMVVEGFRV